MNSISKIRKWITPLLTALMWGILAFILAMSLSFLFDRKNFLTIGSLGVVVMIITNILWTPQGKDMANATAKVRNNNTLFNNRVAYIINEQKFKELREWCEVRNEEYHRELITNRLAKEQIGIGEYDMYCKLVVANSRYESADAYKDLVKFKLGYSKKQLKLLEHIRLKGIHFKRLKPDDILKMDNKKNHLVPINTEKPYLAIRMLRKIFTGVLCAIFSAYILISTKQITAQTIMQLAIWTYSIAMNIYSSITAGYASIYKMKNDYVVDKLDRCCEFFKYLEVDVKDIDLLVADLLVEDTSKKKKVKVDTDT